MDNLGKYRILYKDETWTLYKISEGIGFITGAKKIDFSSFTGGIQIGTMYKYYGDIGIPEEIKKLIYLNSYQMVVTYLFSSANHSIFFHGMHGGSIVSPLPQSVGNSYTASFRFMVPLITGA